MLWLGVLRCVEAITLWMLWLGVVRMPEHYAVLFPFHFSPHFCLKDTLYLAFFSAGANRLQNKNFMKMLYM